MRRPGFCEHLAPDLEDAAHVTRLAGPRDAFEGRYPLRHVLAFEEGHERRERQDPSADADTRAGEPDTRLGMGRPPQDMRAQRRRICFGPGGPLQGFLDRRRAPIEDARPLHRSTASRSLVDQCDQRRRRPGALELEDLRVVGDGPARPIRAQDVGVDVLGHQCVETV